MYKPGEIVRAVYDIGLRTTVDGFQRVQARDIKVIPGICLVIREFLGDDGKYVELFSQTKMKRYVVPAGYVFKVDNVEDAINELRERKETRGLYFTRV
jgi:hypothetical protein